MRLPRCRPSPAWQSPPLAEAGDHGCQNKALGNATLATATATLATASLAAASLAAASLVSNSFAAASLADPSISKASGGKTFADGGREWVPMLKYVPLPR